MNETENKFVVNRAETLAREFLTRRPEVVIHPFQDYDLDLVVTLDPSESLKIEGFSPFGVIVWGHEQAHLLGASGLQLCHPALEK